MGDNFLEARFSPECRKGFQEKLDLFDKSRNREPCQIPVKFFGKFDASSRKAVQSLVQEVIYHARMHRLEVTAAAEIAFFSDIAWRKKRKVPILKKIPLPSAKLDWKNGAPIVQLIVPGRIEKSVIVINTVRLLCSILFGKLFFNRYVPGKTAFRPLASPPQEKISFQVEEKTRFCKLLGRFSKEYNTAFANIGKEFGIRGSRSVELGKKEFFRELLTKKENSNRHYTELLEQSFETTIRLAVEDPSRFFQDCTSLFFRLLEQTTLILPHEKRGFRHLAQTEQWTVFNTLEEKLRFAIACIGEIADTFDFLAEISASNPIVHSTASLRQNVLRELILRLKRRGLVKDFLIDGATFSKKQKEERDAFPLWVWRHRLVDATGASPPKEQIKAITNQYRNSAYQKLFEAAFRLMKAIDRMKASDKMVFTEVPDCGKIKSLVVWLNLRKETLADVRLSCQVAEQIPKLAARGSPAGENLLDSFSRGWSYFISFALVHQYYLKIERGGKGDQNRADTFFHLIEKYARERIDRLPSFQLAILFLELYREERFDLTAQVRLIREESSTLDFFVLNRSMLLRRSDTSAINVIRSYSESIRQWQAKYEENRITQHELDAVSRM